MAPETFFPSEHAFLSLGFLIKSLVFSVVKSQKDALKLMSKAWSTLAFNKWQLRGPCEEMHTNVHKSIMAHN